jgi:hypothetical protein
MSKVSINESTLTSIGEAIRAKTGKSELIAPLDMPDEINAIQTGGGEVEPIVLSGDCTYACSGAIASSYVNKFGSTISTANITKANNMFMNFTGDRIPFTVNLRENHEIGLTEMFKNCIKLRSLPKVLNAKPTFIQSIFMDCQSLREIPEDYFDTWDFSVMKNTTSAYSYACQAVCQGCHSLRKLPLGWLEYTNPVAYTSYSYFSSGFCNCFALDELVNMPIANTATYTSSLFYNFVENCYRLKRFTFKTNEDGTSLVKNWKSQTIDLTKVGTALISSYITDCNSGITVDKRVTSDETYQALKNDPDWYTERVEYSRYNHDSAVETINSLPDTSAYLATAGGTNTIKFKGAAGSKTDGGAINTLTEAEIAVAAAKGWTVTLV